MANGMMLYWGSGSAPCWRVMLVLREKGLEYKDKMVSFEKKEHKSEEILQINPRGQLPAFKHGNIIINESMAICEYLEATFKEQGSTLIPDSPEERGLVLQRAFEALNVHTNCIAEVVLYHWRTKEEDKKEEDIRKREEAFRKEVQLWEGYFVKMGDKSFVAGKTFSMADCVFFPLFAFLVRMGLDLKRYPQLAKYYNMVSERPSVKSTWPPHWKDSENKTMLQNI
ncbi:glutathione S-transferase A-like [Liolophura sinensis]|uniref:glutathione S-transferase A-like n=1 Tax=Liolophura sinensis TaxID=3198878 RepID=UPI0031592BDF